jgi:hypothetical protein
MKRKTIFGFETCRLAMIGTDKNKEMKILTFAKLIEHYTRKPRGGLNV